MKPRPNYMAVWKELAADKSMVFISGPRQVGKTTLAKSISQNFANHVYFNLDIPSDRIKLIENPAFFEALERKDPSLPLVVLDEIHKYKDWKNYLKGTYDRFCDQFRFLVTGSGRLDTYQKGGDSLAGRYYLFHLWPFTIGEISGQNRKWQVFADNPFKCQIRKDKTLKASWDHLATYSGFPEPFLAAKSKTWQRWSNTYGQQLIREDIRDLTQIRSIGDMETLFYLLPSKIGSPISITSLAHNLKVSYNTIRDWLKAAHRSEGFGDTAIASPAKIPASSEYPCHPAFQSRWRFSIVLKRSSEDPGSTCLAMVGNFTLVRNDIMLDLLS